VIVGIDVGAAKGFHLAVLDEHGALGDLRTARSARDTAELVVTFSPRLVAVDSPRRPAPDGLLSRPEERELARAVCGIRYTPHARALGLPELANDVAGYHGWIRNGLRLYELLDQRHVEAIECFPTASWTRFVGPRGRRSRAAWTRRGLAALGLAGLPVRTNQDERDAICAAATAFLAAVAPDAVQWFGAICVPAPGAQVASSPAGLAAGRSGVSPRL
jgi:predicted nuclease with RNAse H fold